MRTNAVVDVITQYLIIFGPLLGEIKKEGIEFSNLNELSTSAVISRRFIYLLLNKRISRR